MSSPRTSETIRPDTPAGTSRSASRKPGTKIRVCHVSMCLLTGGLERLLVEFGRNRDGERFETSYVALDGVGAPAEELRKQGHHVECVADVASGKLGRLRRLARIFRRGRFNVVHTHNTLAHFYGAFAAKLAGVPVVVNTQHGRGCGKGWKAKLQFRMANQLTDKVIGVSEDAAALCRRDDVRAADRTVALWNGVDLDRFEYRGPSAEPVAISVARLSPEKDFETLIRATWILIKDRPDFRLRIVGDGSERSRLERLAKELNLNDHVEFLGERSDISQLMSKAGFFVSSSLSEGISLTLLEAMSVGLPVVTTRVGGNPEIVVEGKTGRLVSPNSPEQLALAMRDLLRDQEGWPVYGELARQRVEQHFDVRNMVRQYENLYRELIEGLPARP
ncbi:MAG: glycosyltransferase [Planctomycetota bacterium]|nr:glycosyltransferase [Planctomycetota bacterium]MDA1161477.1 glycosyltransferase [Planctomycetota bacterium]